MRKAALLSVLVLLACSTPIPIRFATHQAAAPVVVISNPYLMEGNAAAGRQAFIDLQCVDCHRVAADPSLPMGRRSIAGPVLEHLERYSAHDLAGRITSRDTGASQELFEKTMKDYTQPITARQLVDIVAYLRATSEPRG
ncbi:MAG TPA: c-type cytochrome [Thermoanaerobaculia bacterium]|nr:c-type cytochrome [Thermoanaerobaculia bacterium]